MAVLCPGVNGGAQREQGAGEDLWASMEVEPGWFEAGGKADEDGNSTQAHQWGQTAPSS